MPISQQTLPLKRGGHAALDSFHVCPCAVMHNRGLWAQALTMRKGELREMLPLEVEGKQRLVFEAPSRGLIGFRSAFATLTRGTGLMHRAFAAYGPFRGALDRVRKGVLVSTAGARPAPEQSTPCTSHPGTVSADARLPSIAPLGGCLVYVVLRCPRLLREVSARPRTRCVPTTACCALRAAPPPPPPPPPPRAPAIPRAS